ncbi:MAG: chorismate-binding protein [Bdellovibrionaceae bacterium]|nr:chorismate-binding protein [Pseudobdellovibrionaceae bacterium]
MNTNFLKDTAVAKAFYNEGAFVQTSSDSFRVFIGPFKGHISLASAQAAARAKDEPILYNSNFWDFLQLNTQKSEYFTSEDSFHCTRDELIKFSAKKDSTIDNINWQIAGKAEFKQQYDWIQSHITQGKLSKALPIALSKGRGNIPSRLPAILEKIIYHPTANYSYGFWNSKSGMIGYTPEVLSSWSKNNSELKTMALAGTWRKNLIDPAPNFSDPKVKEEHNFVIQDIQNQLKTFSMTYQSQTTVVELPYLYHLKTNFSYQCESVEKYLQAVHLLHPTAALGLFPREPKMAHEFSHINIQEKRQQFGAPLGFVSHQDGFMLVAIRNIMWSSDHIQLFAGCGVTDESLFEDEWLEILAKQDSVKKMLGVES